MPKKLQILVSPLDWGLGHATRMVPIIQHLDQLGHHLMIGVNELTSSFLKPYFPQASFYDIPSYNIRYSAGKSYLSMMSLIPKILEAKKAEQKWVAQFVKENKVDLIISDSRFGFRHQTIPSVIISHQLSLPYPKPMTPFAWIAQKFNETWLGKFNHIWVPDFADHLLSGKLSENKKLIAQFVQPQSRLKKSNALNPLGKEYVLCILSGPEPQRSKLEEILISQARNTSKQIVIVGGKPSEIQASYELSNILYFPHLGDELMTAYLQNASIIISRSGYSSIMDYYTLGCRKFFLIPTPGQSEQIYLAKRLKQLQICDFAYQDTFNLSKAMDFDTNMHGFSSGTISNFDWLDSFLNKEFQ